MWMMCVPSPSSPSRSVAIRHHHSPLPTYGRNKKCLLSSSSAPSSSPGQLHSSTEVLLPQRVLELSWGGSRSQGEASAVTHLSWTRRIPRMLPKSHILGHRRSSPRTSISMPCMLQGISIHRRQKRCDAPSSMRSVVLTRVALQRVERMMILNLAAHPYLHLMSAVSCELLPRASVLWPAATAYNVHSPGRMLGNCSRR